MKNHLTWLIVFDSICCRVYQYNKQELHLLKELQHPENRLRDIDITTDKAGRYIAGGAHGSYSQQSDPKEVKIDNFSREIASILEHHYNKNEYEKLIIVAAPHINGMLMKHLKPKIVSCITHSIKKDLMHFSEKELLSYVQEI